VNEIKQGKTMSLKEIAKATGASYRTVAAYAQKAGWTQNGKATRLNEAQVTSVIQRIAEVGGCLLTDRDDLLSAYRR
jgi:transposase